MTQLAVIWKLKTERFPVQNIYVHFARQVYCEKPVNDRQQYNNLRRNNGSTMATCVISEKKTTDASRQDKLENVRLRPGQPQALLELCLICNIDTALHCIQVRLHA